MYKILTRSLIRPEKSLANFTSIYRRVANNRHSSATSQTKNSVPRNHTEDEDGNSSKSQQRPSLRTKSSTSVSNGKGFTLPKRSWLAEAKETVHIMMFSTSTSKYFYASTLNQAKQPLISQKYFKNQKALDLYKQALEQCMKIKFERHRIQRKTKNVVWTPAPFKPNNVNETIALARSKIEKTLPPEDKPKKIVRLHPKKSISVEKMKHLVKQKKALQYVKKKTFRIVYPTHIIKYKLGLQKPYHLEKSMAKKLRSVVSTSEPEMSSVKPVLKREINTVEVVPSKKDQNNDLLAVMAASKKRREKEVVADGAIQHLISQHPAMKRVTNRAKMSINQKYNIILLKSQAKIKLQMKPNQVTADTSEEFKLSTTPPKQNESLTHFEQAESEENKFQRKLESDINIVQHPISTNLDQNDSQLNVKYTKCLMSEKNETFDIDDICLKTKENYIVYTDEISDAIRKINLEKKEIESLKQEAPEEGKNIDKNEDDLLDKSLVGHRLRALLKRNEKQGQSASVNNQNPGTPAQSLFDYIKKLNDFKDQTSMERSSIRKPFSKTTETQKIEVDEVYVTEDNGENVDGVKNEIVKHQQGTKEENRERNNEKSLQEILLEQKVAQELIRKQLILTMNKENKVEEVVRKTGIPRIETLSLSQSTDTSIRKTTSKYLLENIKPIRTTDDQTEEVPLKKTDANDPSKNQRFKEIMRKYIVKPTHKESEIDAPKNGEIVDEPNPRSIDSKKVPRYPDQKNSTPVEDITEEISREEYSPHNREKLKSISKYANQRLEQISFRQHRDTFKIAPEENTKKESNQKIDKPESQEITVVTSKDEHNIYKDKLKNLLEPANQYFERLREAGENQIKTLGVLKDQFKSQISENIGRGLKMKNMLENMPKNIVDNDKKLSTNTFIVDDVGKESEPKKTEKSSSCKDSCLLVFKESSGKDDEVYDVIQIDLDNKKSKSNDGTDEKQQTSNIGSNEQNTSYNNRPTIRQEIPPQKPPKNNNNDKKDDSTGSKNIVLPPPRKNDSPKLSRNLDSSLNKNETRSNKENEAGTSWHKNRLENSEIVHEKLASEGSKGVKQDIMKSECAQELEELENIIFKHKSKTKDCLDAAFIPEKFPNQQLFKNWLSILKSIEKLEIEYKDGSDSKSNKKVNNLENNLNTDDPPVENSQIEFDPFKKASYYQPMEKDIILEEKNEGQNMKEHPNLLNHQKPNAKISSEESMPYNDNKLKFVREDAEEKPVQQTFKPVDKILVSRNEEKINLISGEVKQETVKKGAISKKNDSVEQGIRGHPNLFHREELGSIEKSKSNENVEIGKPELNMEKSEVIPTQKTEDQEIIAHSETLKPENISPVTFRKLGKHVIGEKTEKKVANPPPKMMDYENSSENKGVIKIEQKIEDKAIISQQITKNLVKNTRSAIKQKETSEKKVSHKKVGTTAHSSTTKQAEVDIKSTPPEPINSSVKVSNTSLMKYSGPKLSVEKKQEQTAEKWKPNFCHNSTSNFVKKVTTIEENNNSNAPKKVEKSNICNLNNKHELKHQSRSGTDVKSKEKDVQKAISDSGNIIRGKTETRLMKMYLLDEHEGYDELIAGLREKIEQPKIANDNVDMKKPSVKPVSKHSFKPKHVLDSSQKKISADPSKNIPKKDPKGINLVEEATFRRNDVSEEMKNRIPREEPGRNSSNVSSVNENKNENKPMIVQREKKIKHLRGFFENANEDRLRDNSKKSHEDLDKTKTTKSPEQPMVMQEKDKLKPRQKYVAESKLSLRSTMQNDQLRNKSKECDNDVEKTKSTKSLEELDKNNSSSNCISDYMRRVKENRGIRAKSPNNEHLSQEKHKVKAIKRLIKEKSKPTQESVAGSKMGLVCQMQNDKLKDNSKKRNEYMEKTKATKSLEELNKDTSSPDCSSYHLNKTKEKNQDIKAKSLIHEHSSQNKEKPITIQEKQKSKHLQESKVNMMCSEKFNKNMKKTTAKSIDEHNKVTSSQSDCSSDYLRENQDNRDTKAKSAVNKYPGKEKRVQKNVVESKTSTSLRDNSKKSNMEKTNPIKSLEELNKSTSSPECFVEYFKRANKSRIIETKLVDDKYSSHEKHKQKPMTMQENILLKTVTDSKMGKIINSREDKLEDKQSNDIEKTTTTKPLEELKVSSASDGYSSNLKKVDVCQEINDKKTSGVKYTAKNDIGLPNQPHSTAKTVCENKSYDNNDRLLDESLELEKNEIQKVKKLDEGKTVSTAILEKTKDKPETKICTSNSMKMSWKSDETENKTKSRENSQNMTNIDSYLISNRSSPNSPKMSEKSNESSQKIKEESQGSKAENKDYSKIAVRKPEEKTKKLMKTNYIEDNITNKNECDINLKKSSSISENASKNSSQTILEAVRAKDLAEENKEKPEVTKENPKDKSTGPGKKQKVIIRLSRYPSSFNPTKPTSEKNNFVPNTKSKEESSKHQAKIKEILSIEPKTVLDYIIDDQLKKRNVKPERMLEEAKILKQKYHNERLHRVMDKYRADIDKIEDSYNQKIAPADEELLRQRKYKENESETFKRKIDEEFVRKELPKKVEHEANLERGQVQNDRMSTKDSSSYVENKIKANYESYLLKNKANELKLISRAKSSKYLLENQVNHMRRMKNIRKQKNECYLIEKIGMEKTNTFKLILKVPHKEHREIEITTEVDDIFIKKDGKRSNKDLSDKQLPAELKSSNRTFPLEKKKEECKFSSSKYLLENKTLVSTEKFQTNGNECGKPNSPKGSKKLHSDAAITISGKIKAEISKILPTLSIVENQPQFGKMIIDTDLSSLFPEVPQKNNDGKDKAEIKEIFHRKEKLLKFNKILADHMITQSTENQLKNKSVDSNLNRFLFTDLEKKERYRKYVCDQSIQKETEQNERPKNFLGTIVLRKIVDGTDLQKAKVTMKKESLKPKAKLTMEKELPKYPTEKKKTDNKKSITKSCDRLCVPPKTISQAFYSLPRDDITTLTKSSNDRIVSIPNKPAKKFDIHEKYKGLKISFIKVRKTEKKNEHFLPALSSIKGENNMNESNQNLENKAKILAFRREFLRKLKEEFDFLDKNQHNFQKVREHYETVLRESTENNDNKSVFKFPTIHERPKDKERVTDDTVSDSMLSLDSDHVPKNCTRLLIKELTNKESNDNKESETSEKPKIDPKKK